MRLLFTPYSFKKFFDKTKRVSGIDESIIRQAECLKAAGHDVLFYLPYSNCVGKEYKVFSTDTEAPYQKNKDAVLQDFRKTIVEFNPDCILSSTSFNKLIFRCFDGYPVFYLTHCLPGSPADMAMAPFLMEFLAKGNTLGCVSEFHRMKTDSFYSHPRKLWGGTMNIRVDHIVPSSYSEVVDVKENDTRTVAHISACNAWKGTFIPHKMLHKQKQFVSDTYTTTKHLGGDKEMEYWNDNMPKFSSDNFQHLKTTLDVPHSELMQRIKAAICFYVSKSTTETFSITAIEALQAGLPVLFYGKQHVHPANDFVETKFKKYVAYFTTEQEFLHHVRTFSTMTLDDRKELAASCVRTMGKDKFTAKYEDAIYNTINRFKNVSAESQTGLEGFFDD